MTIKTNVNAGGMSINHNQGGVKLKSAVNTGGFKVNHNQALA